MSEKKKVLTVECPSCKTKVEWCERNDYRPFCSQRCHDADFCAWTGEEHRISGNATYDDILSEDMSIEELRPMQSTDK